MCDRYPYANHDTVAPDVVSPPLPAAKPAFVAAQARSSRRSRLWELPGHTHCPLIGVCLSMPLLRRLIGKAIGGCMASGDYEVHVAAVAECGRRGAISERIQRELDRRYATVLRSYAQAKSTATLRLFWSEALQGPAVAGALWATLSHPRCDEDLRESVCRDIHMLQHQVGACNRADLQRLEQLQDEFAVLSREAAALKASHARALAQRAAQLEDLNVALVRARGQVIERETLLAVVREELAQLKAQVPELQTRMDLMRRVELQRHRIHELERYRSLWQQLAAREAREQPPQPDVAPERNIKDPAAHSSHEAHDNAGFADLRDKAVLCVGGRTASVPSYRQLIEYTGGKFSHHDGGEQNSAAQLEASLAAADLVICQTGCVSHGAYWRVKDHCKRTGKRCVFVDKPSASSLARCLRELDNLELL